MNSVSIVGRLTRDPELRYIPSSNTPVTRMIIAVDRNMTKEKKEEAQSKGFATADFIPVIVWNKQAENAAKYLDKGSRVAIQGRITTGKYETDQGETRYTTEVTAERVEFLNQKQQEAATQQYDPSDFSSSPELDDDSCPF